MNAAWDDSLKFLTDTGTRPLLKQRGDLLPKLMDRYQQIMHEGTAAIYRLSTHCHENDIFMPRGAPKTNGAYPVPGLLDAWQLSAHNPIPDK
jgi:hypothetical protein